MSSRQNVCLCIVDVFTHTAGAVRASIISRRGCSAACTSHEASIVAMGVHAVVFFTVMHACICTIIVLPT